MMVIRHTRLNMDHLPGNLSITGLTSSRKCPSNEVWLEVEAEVEVLLTNDDDDVGG